MPRRTLILVAGLVVLAGCTRPSAAAFTTQVAPTTVAVVVTSTTVPAPPPTTAAPAPEAIVFTGAGFDLHTAGRVPTAAFNAAWAGALDTLNRYLDAAVLTPLRSGGPAGDLTPLFTPPAAAKVTVAGPDRSAFIDEGLPPLSEVRKHTAVAQLTALAGSDGAMSVITAVLDLRLTGHIGGAPAAVQRTGELVLMPEGGVWRIDAYELKVVRSLDERTTTTTVRS
jgi:hypothetical protein